MLSAEHDHRKYRNTAQAADYCGYALATFEKLRVNGGGPRFIRPPGGRRIMYLVADLDAWMLAGRRGSTSETEAA